MNMASPVFIYNELIIIVLVFDSLFCLFISPPAFHFKYFTLPLPSVLNGAGHSLPETDEYQSLSEKLKKDATAHARFHLTKQNKH